MLNIVDIRLEKLGEQFLEWARELHNDPDVLFVLTDPHEVSEEEQKVWYNKLISSTSSERLVVLTGLNTPIGLFRLDNIDRNNLSASVGLDIHKNFRGLGYATPAYVKILDLLFRTRGFNRVWLIASSQNFRALSLYKKLGFKKEGVLREMLLRNGTFYDGIMMSLLSSEYGGIDVENHTAV